MRRRKPFHNVYGRKPVGGAVAMPNQIRDIRGEPLSEGTVVVYEDRVATVTDFIEAEGGEFDGETGREIQSGSYLVVQPDDGPTQLVELVDLRCSHDGPEVYLCEELEVLSSPSAPAVQPVPVPT